MAGVVLERGDYWELVAALRARQLAYAELAAKEQEVAVARARATEVLDKFAATYKFDPKGAYRCEDATCTLVPTQG